MANKKNNKFIIIIFLILFITLIVLLFILNFYSKNNLGQENDNNVSISVGNFSKDENTKKTIKQIIEESGSTYISEKKRVRIEVEVNFKYDLFDENGKSREKFFNSIIEQIEETQKRTFLLTDKEKNIEIYAIYNPDTQKFTVYINGVENYFDVVEGNAYLELAKENNFKYSDLHITNQLIRKIGTNSSYYANTELASQDREKLENGYSSYNNGSILAKLQNGKALNIVFRKGYEKEIAYGGISVGTPLSEVLEKYPNVSFGGVGEGYLGYIAEYAYVFFYNDEISVYPYERKSNDKFNEYIKYYCENGNLEKLISDFNDNWTSYFEKEYDLEKGEFKITFPVRGIKIDIINNNSDGIVLYSNYPLNQDLKDLILGKKIILKKNEDLVNVTEKARRESM